MANIAASVVYEATSRGFNRVERNVQGVTRHTNTSTQAMGRLNTAMSALTAAAVLAALGKLTGKLAELGKNAAKVGDNLAKTARALGFTIQQLQEYRFAASEAGLGTKQFDTGLQRFTRRVGQAKLGTGGLVKVFKELDIDIGGKDTNAVFKEFLFKLNQMTDEGKKLAFAMAGVDTEAAKAFTELARGIDSSLKSAQLLGTVLDTEVVLQLEAMENELGNIKATNDKLMTEIGAHWVGSVVAMEKYFTIFLSGLKYVSAAVAGINATPITLKANTIAIKKAQKEVEKLRSSRLKLRSQFKGDVPGPFKYRVDNAKKELLVATDRLNKLYQNHKVITDKMKAKGLADIKYNEAIAATAAKNQQKVQSESDAKTLSNRNRLLVNINALANNARQVEIAGIEDDRLRIKAKYDYEIEQARRKEAELLKTAPIGTSNSIKDSTNTLVNGLDKNRSLELIAIKREEAQILKTIRNQATQAEIDNIQDEKIQLTELVAFKKAALIAELTEFNGTADQKVEAIRRTTAEIIAIEQDAATKMIVIGENEKSAFIKFMEDKTTALADLGDVGIFAANGLADSFADFATGAEKDFSKLAKSFIKQITKMIIKMLILRALRSAFGFADGGASAGGGAAVLSSGGANDQFAKGGSFGTTRFAKGGDFTNTIVKSPTRFAHGGGLGLMGEAGPEAIMPLKRGKDGSLGVTLSGGESPMSGSGSVVNNIVVNVTSTGDADKDGDIIARKLMRVIAKDQIITELRPGGLIKQ